MTPEARGAPARAPAARVISTVPAYVEAALPRVPAAKNHRRLILALDPAPQGPGVVDLILDLEAGRLRVGYDPQALSREDAHRLAAHLAARLLDIDTIARSELRVPVRPTGADQAVSWRARNELALLTGGDFLALIIGAVLEHLLIVDARVRVMAFEPPSLFARRR